MATQPKYVKTLVETLQNKAAFGATCAAIEAAVDRHAPLTRSCIVFQTEDVVKISYEGFVFVNAALLDAIRDAIPPAQRQTIRVIKPCVSEHVTDTYAPITVVVQIGTAARAPDADAPAPAPPDAPKLQVNNLRDLSIPDALRMPVLRILNMLYAGEGELAPSLLRGVRFATRRAALIVPNPPTFSHDFLSGLFTAFPGVVADYRFERAKEAGTETTYLTVYLQQLSGGAGYARAKRARGLLSAFSPF